MEDSSCIVETPSSGNSACLIKRKRAHKLADFLNSVKKYRHICKLKGCENCTCLQKSHGSVVYDRFFPEIYEWLANFPVMNANINQAMSVLPIQFTYYDKAIWKPFPKDVSAILCEQFRSGHYCLRLSIHGRTYLVSFLHMMQINLQTGYVRSVAWCDEDTKAWSPSHFFEGHATQLSTLLHKRMDHQCHVESDSRVTGRLILHQTRESDIGPGNSAFSRLTMDSSSCCSFTSGSKRSLDVEREVSSHDFTLLGDRLIKLEHGDKEYHEVIQKFLAGLRILSAYTSIVGVYRDTHRSASGHVRLHAFEKQEEITKKTRGDANVCYAWHGTSKYGVSGIVLHGFGIPKAPKNGSAYGCGVYLTPERLSRLSALYSDVDENGDQHMILCRVIMGNMEQVPVGSQQFHPSSEHHDTGVDDRLNPKRYIVWSTHMNTHILPEYVVSFKIAPEWHDILSTLKGRHAFNKRIQVQDLRKKLTNESGPLNSTTIHAESTHKKVVMSMPSCRSESSNTPNGAGAGHSRINNVPRSPWVSFPNLFHLLGLKLPPSDMSGLQQCYVEFKAGRMPRESFVRSIRAVVGDHLLAESIRSMQAQVQASSECM